jgi:hypothetical protein
MFRNPDRAASHRILNLHVRKWATKLFSKHPRFSISSGASATPNSILRYIIQGNFSDAFLHSGRWEPIGEEQRRDARQTS